MFTARLRRPNLSLPLPQSLRWQFILVVSALAVLIAASSLTAFYALGVSAQSIQHLTEERLVRRKHANELVQRTLLI